MFISGLSYKIIMPVLGVSVPIVLIVISYIYTHADALIKKGFYPATRIMSWLDPTITLIQQHSKGTLSGL